MRRASREEVARTVEAEPGRLRRASRVGVLALLAASALTPVAAVALGGGDIAEALAGFAGNVGSGYLTELVQKAAGRLGRRPDRGQLRDALAEDLRRALEKGDAAAEELNAELTGLLIRVDGFEAAVTAARDELRAYLIECFTEMVQRQRAALDAIGDIRAEQRRQGRDLRDLLEAVGHWLRRIEGRVDERPAPPGAPPAIVITPPGRVAQRPPEWRGGEDIAVDGRDYLLHDRLLQEWTSSDQALVRRQAQAQRMNAAGRYVWVRQAEMRRGTPAAEAALAALGREHELLRDLGKTRGIPRIDRFAGGRTATLVLVWPASRTTGVACETLDVFLDGDGVPLDPWRLSRLGAGLAGLCDTLSVLHRRGLAHRFLTPSGIVMVDNGGLALRDLGLAASDPESGEGPPDHQAPEQRRRRADRPGPATDVYQVGAVAYHLITGHPPHPATPPPVRALAPEAPERVGSAIDAALAAEPADRPPIHRLGAALRTTGRRLEDS